MSSPGRSPARRAGKGQLPNLKGTPQHAISPYRKAAAESLRGSWKSVALPDIPGQGPVGPAGPVEGPLSPDPAFQAKEGKALSAWVQAAQNGDAEAQNKQGNFRAAYGQLRVARNLGFSDPPTRERAVQLLRHVERYIAEFESANKLVRGHIDEGRFQEAFQEAVERWPRLRSISAALETDCIWRRNSTKGSSKKRWRHSPMSR